MIRFQFAILILFISLSAFANFGVPPLQGEILNTDEPIPYATVQVKSTSVGSASDANGKFIITDLPEGEQTLVIKAMGHKSKEIKVTISYDKPLNLNITLEEDVLGLEQIVVTADKTQKTRIEASAIVNTLTPKTLSQVQAVTISESLNFTPGLRMETNCQNCGANAVRMNGMEGSHSQVLINGRQIFCGLASVYGLEIIPANMIQQIEVIKGGGSALYGSNAVAGTINLITKEPTSNIFQANAQEALIGIDENSASDYNVNINTAVISEDKKSGIALYATHRKRDGWDANGDDFTELSQLNQSTFGTNIYHRIGFRNKITFDYFHITEDRRGGDMLDAPEHEANIAESLEHKINTGAINFTRFVSDNGELSIYAAGQYVDRWSYYGARSYEDEDDEYGTPDLSCYGTTNEFSYSYGADYKGIAGRTNYVFGIENLGSNLIDKKTGYTDLDSGEYYDAVTVSNQTLNTLGIFAQYDYEWEKLTLSVGARLDHYNIKDKEDNDGNNSNTVLSPRLNLLYKPTKTLQIRASYSSGYRAPQIFNEDLHIESSGSRTVYHDNTDDLTQETSHSTMLSFDYQTKLGSGDLEILAEGFYTELIDAFAYEYEYDETTEVTTSYRYNSEGANVRGINLEARYFPSANWDIDFGFTSQMSQYKETVGYFEDTYFTKDFFRTPNSYGYFTFNTDPIKNLTLSVTGSFTGSMLLEYYGSDLDDPDTGELRESDRFFDAGFKAEYFIRNNKGFDLSFSCGIKNIFNSYQDDFDSDINRDPGYIYGPALPRSVNFGIKIGNIL